MAIFASHLEAIGLQRRLFSTRPPTAASRWVGSLLAGTGLLLLSHAFTELLRVSSMQGWPVAKGEVVSLSIERSAGGRVGAAATLRFRSTRTALLKYTSHPYPGTFYSILRTGSARANARSAPPNMPILSNHVNIQLS